MNDILDLSRIESGKVVFSPVPADITAVTDSAIEIINGTLLNRSLNFEVHREPMENPYVMTEPVRIREILVNILNNAVKFTNDGGTIRLDVSNRPGADAQHRVVCYRVQETGVGMSEEFLTKLFDEFAQEQNDARTQYKGTGLGMPITKGYVELMGGTIAVESKKGVGTTFTVEIPMELTSSEKVEKTKKPAKRKSLKGIKVLLAEDNDLNAELATILLEDSEMIVTRAADGQEVVDLFANHPAGTYDIILMDIMMPKMDGITVLRKVRESGNSVPVLLLTAKSEIDDRVTGLDSGADDYLTKPFATKELLARIRAMTRRKGENTGSLLNCGNISLNRSTFEVSSPKATLRLANKEFQMLEMLMSNEGMIISTERFMEKIWGYDTETNQNVVWVYVSYLRKKLAALDANVTIKAVRNRGYALEAVNELKN